MTALMAWTLGGLVLVLGVVVLAAWFFVRGVEL